MYYFNSRDKFKLCQPHETKKSIRTEEIIFESKNFIISQLMSKSKATNKVTKKEKSLSFILTQDLVESAKEIIRPILDANPIGMPVNFHGVDTKIHQYDIDLYGSIYRGDGELKVQVKFFLDSKPIYEANGAIEREVRSHSMPLLNELDNMRNDLTDAIFESEKDDHFDMLRINTDEAIQVILEIFDKHNASEEIRSIFNKIISDARIVNQHKDAFSTFYPMSRCLNEDTDIISIYGLVCALKGATYDHKVDHGIDLTDYKKRIESDYNNIHDITQEAMQILDTINMEEIFTLMSYQDHQKLSSQRYVLNLIFSEAIKQLRAEDKLLV